MSKITDLRKKLEKSIENTPIEFKAIMGRADGEVKYSQNEVYVTLMNGDVITIYNDRLPRIAYRKIIIGYLDNDPSLLQVIRFDNVYATRPTAMIVNHKESHAWYAHDPVDISAQQILPLLPRAIGGLSVRVYGGQYKLDSLYHVLPTTDFDMSAEVPTTGAEWVNVEVDAAGVVTYNHGSSLAGRELLTPEDIPATDPALKLLCSVKMYAGQSDIIQTRSSTDIYDPRFAGVESVWGYITGTLTDQADLQAALNAKLDDSQLDTDGTLAANSDSKIATQKATKTYVDNAVTGLLEFKGSTNASTNPNYPSASKGDAYVVSTAGKVGGSSGKAVDIGDVYLAIADNAGGTEAAVGTSWIVLEHNLAGALLSANNLSDVANTTTARSNLGLVIGTDVQAHDADLDAIAGLTPSNDDIIQRKAGAWVSRTIAQLVTDIRTVLDSIYPAISAVVPVNGWIPDTHTWTRTGNHTFEISGNATSYLTKGCFVKYTDSAPSDDYGVVYSSSYSAGPNKTTITLITNTNFLMAAGTISATYYSYMANPAGWPGTFDYTPTISAQSGSFTSVTINSAKYFTMANSLDMKVDITVVNKGTASGILLVAAPCTLVASGATGTGREDDVTGSMLQFYQYYGGSVIASTGVAITNGYHYKLGISSLTF